MSDKSLFMVEVEIRFQMVVLAADAQAAAQYVDKNYERGLEDTYLPEVFGTPEPLESCPENWRGCLPYGASDRKAVEQYFDEASA